LALFLFSFSAWSEKNGWPGKAFAPLACRLEIISPTDAKPTAGEDLKVRVEVYNRFRAGRVHVELEVTPAEAQSESSKFERGIFAPIGKWVEMVIKIPGGADINGLLFARCSMETSQGGAITVTGHIYRGPVPQRKTTSAAFEHSSGRRVRIHRIRPDENREEAE
jgi:hypothetical protein